MSRSLSVLILASLITALLSGCAGVSFPKSEQRSAEAAGAAVDYDDARPTRSSPARDQPAPEPMTERESPASHAPAGPQEAPHDFREVEEAESAQPDTGGVEQLPPEDPVSNAEGYEDYGVNTFMDPSKDRLSTFAIDVDTASYTIARRKLEEGTLPPSSAVRVEEFVNFFRYDYKQPDGQTPFNVDFEAAPSPFDPDHTFLRVGVQGLEVAADKRPPVHLVFLVDTSGSMQTPDKIGLLKQALTLLVENLRPDDTVALATYAGSTTKVLDPTSVREKGVIISAIARLEAGGSTAMANGLQLAYDMAYKNLKPEHINRVIVCSDGDANVGPSSHEEILRTIRDYTQEGVTLSTIGFGMGNYKDTMMEQLANQGNGNYYYIDTFKQAEQIFQTDLVGTLMVIAKDVKIQVEFNPESVESYRLLGYENRDIADKDFRNDAVDAGEIGAGHSVTAIYELKLKPSSKIDPATVRIRHKAPEGGRAAETTYAFPRDQVRADFGQSGRAFQLAVSVAAFAEILRRSPFAADWNLGKVRAMAANAAGDDAREQELVRLIDIAVRLSDGPRAER